MRLTKPLEILVLVSLGLALPGGIPVSRTAAAQSASPQAGAKAASDEYQRSAEIYNMKTVAKEGAERGEEIYYIKCWMCHNKYAKAGGPPLAGLYKRPKLLSGPPVNDQTVAEKIRQGGPAMPSYRHALTDKDMADLLSYLRGGKCCFEGDEPPRNPRYRYH